MREGIPEHEPCYVISVAAKMLGIHQQTLRYYEREGLIEPSRSRGNIRLYSLSDINRLRQVQRLINDLGVNLAGAAVILQMSERIQAMEAELQQLRERLRRFQQNSPVESAPRGAPLV
jgi:MerR family transcriptional regulator/heat shock protein HspR